MLTPDYLAGVSAPMQDIYADLQTDIEADIARRIKKAGYTTDTAAWQIEKLKQMGSGQAYITRRIAAQTGLTQLEVHDMFTAAGIKSSLTDEATRTAMIAAGKAPANKIPFAADPAFRQVMEANLKKTMGTLQKLTGTMATDAAGQLNKYMDQAQMLVQSGAFTQQQAIGMTVKKFADDGIHAFDYASGARTSVEAAVRRALVTGVNQATSQVSLANAQTLGTDLVEVTSHGDARPEHATWQGGIYSLAGTHAKYPGLAVSTGYGTGAGLCGWNCRHSFYAFVEGVSEALPKEKYDPAVYEAEQKQRYNERMIREWKRKANTLREGGSDPAKAEAKVREWQAKQRAHVLDNDLTRMYDREKVYGMGTLPPIIRTPRPIIPALTEGSDYDKYWRGLSPELADEDHASGWLKEIKAGARPPVLVDESNLSRIIDGNHKLWVYQKLGIEPPIYKMNRIDFLNGAAKVKSDVQFIKDSILAGTATPVKFVTKSVEEIAVAKRDAVLAASRERTRAWREGKKTALESTKEAAARIAEEAKALAEEAAEAAREAVKKAEAKAILDKWSAEEAAATKKEALRAASKERTRVWSESKKATLPSPAEIEAKKIRDSEALARTDKAVAEKTALHTGTSPSASAVSANWSDAEKRMVGPNNLKEWDTPNKPNKYPANDPLWGTEPGQYTVYRSGELNRGIIFTGNEMKGVEWYTEAFSVDEAFTRWAVNSYTVDIKKPFISTNLPEAYSKLFGKMPNIQGSANWIKADERVMSALKKQGYDSWLMTSPAPPATKELVLFGKPSMTETSRTIPKHMKDRIRKEAAENGYFANAYVDGKPTLTLQEWWNTEAYKAGKVAGKWN